MNCSRRETRRLFSCALPAHRRIAEHAEVCVSLPVPVRRHCPIVSGRFLALLFALVGLAASPVVANDTGRFTRSLTPAERAESGVDKLSSDEAAVLDALVRRDTASRVSTSSVRPPQSNADKKAPADGDPAMLVEPPSAPRFSERLTADERRIAGFNHLSVEQTTRLNALIERHASASVARALLSPPSFVSRGGQVQPLEKNDDRKNIHGSYSLSFGWGKGGYSERSGSMMMTYDDPAGRYSVTIGYTETHVKGGPGVYIEGPPYRGEGLPYRAP